MLLNHIIMDYSIHDAIEAGFNHVVFIIWKDINDIPDTLSEGRTKLWGTGQAVLAAKKVINPPFKKSSFALPCILLW